MRILCDIIYNLTVLADEIEVEDKNITKELEEKIQLELNQAIKDISEAKALLGPE